MKLGYSEKIIGEVILMKKIFLLSLLFFSLLFLYHGNAKCQWVRTNQSVDSTVECLTASNSSLFAGTSNGIYRSTNIGDDWTRLNTGLIQKNVIAIVRMGEYLFAASIDNSGCSTIIRSIDDGTTWSQVSNNFPSPYVCTGVLSLLVKDTDLFVGAACGGVFLSTNRGDDWIAIDSGIQGKQKFQATALAETPTSLFVKTDVGDCSFGAANAIFRSTNNGTVWSKASDSISIDDLSGAAFALLGTNLFVGMYRTVYQWSDSNFRWSKVGTNLSGPIQSLLVSGQKIFAACEYPQSDRIFLSNDSAKTWISVSAGLENVSKYSNPFQLAVNDRYLFVGIIDNGVWRRPLSDFGISEVKDSTAFTNEIRISPNPTTGILTIHNAPQNLTSVAIVNVLGEKVFELANPHTSDFMIDLSKLPPGMYYARFLVGSSVDVKKIIKE